MSGGFDGQVGVYGLPSGRLLKHVPVFSQNPENGWGYSEQTKPMLTDQLRLRPLGRRPPSAAVADRRRARRPLAVHQRQQHAAHRPARPDPVRDRGDPRDPQLGRQPLLAVRHARTAKYVVAAHAVQRAGRRSADVSIDDYKENFSGMLTLRQGGQRHRPHGDRLPDPACPASTTTCPRGQGPVARLVFFTSYNSEEAQHQARGERLAEGQGLHRRDQLEAGRAVRRAGQGEDRAGPLRPQPDGRGSASRGPSGARSVKMLDPGRLPRAGLLPPDPEVARTAWTSIRPASTSWPAASSRRSSRCTASPRCRRRSPTRRSTGEDRRHPGAQVRGRHRRRGAEPRPGPAAHRVRRQGLRLHLDVLSAPRS